MKRVMILGQPGSGKSTLAVWLGQLTGLPVVHIDRIHHMPGWVERPKPEKIVLAMAEQAKDRWIMEGGLSATYPNRMDRADTIIWLDLPLGLRVRRVVWRTLRFYGTTRPDMQDDCPEGFHWDFFKWIWDTRRTGRQGPARVLASAGPEKALFHLKSPKDVRNFQFRIKTEFDPLHSTRDSTT
ncbi:P-loop NTPase family protein [Thalassococcus lentus]|uniref:AAA family ATPase n=1 Tax=Thalassococcus lentus TaxID=1210524 RepID=A0ABT4XNB4_9RHOB|nr:AAA family ATPase [Thalassococcus lentus]MDA7423430.1 AAA family ATPase [Thalassococcus lentus]